MKKKKIGLLLSIIGVLTLTFGITYAAYSNIKNGLKNQILITGDIYMNYLESNQINITNGVPMTKEKALKSQENVFNFQIVGKNTSQKDVYYGISLVEGDEIEGKTRIKTEDVDVYLTSGDKVLIDGVRYKDFDNQKIWVDTISAGTTTEITKDYSLKVWIDEKVEIGNTSGADYTIEEWNDSYFSLKVNVDGNLDKMNIPLSLETEDTYVENGKAYFIAKVSNYLDMNTKNIRLAANDSMNLVINGTNEDVLFSYKDSEGNEDTTPKESLNLEYNFNTNKTVEVQVFVTPKNDANGSTDINVKLTKNEATAYELVKRMSVKGNKYCLNNGFTKLGDCLLVSEHQTENVETAKTKIAAKGYPNLNDTAPSYTYVEQTTLNVSNPVTINNNKIYVGENYTFNQATGQFTINTNTDRIFLSDEYVNYYTCGTVNSTCDTIYKILGTNTTGTTYKITLADKITYKIASTLRSEVGLYETEDDYGKTYFYRGDVENNNVYFGGYYWKIIRINGDGSIRLIYNGTTPNATGNQTSINNTPYQYNERYPDPTYVGYMYGENFSLQTSQETTYTSILALTKYYFADDYVFDEATKTFKLAGNISEAHTFSEMNSLGENGFKKYPYTCRLEKATANCHVIIKVNSYINETKVKAQYIAYSSNNLEGTRTNTKDSTVKEKLDTWYQTNIIGKKDSDGNLLTNYIVDGSFCNDRSFASNNSGNGYSLVPSTFYSAYKRLYSDSNKTATLKCSSNADNFSTTSNRGNAKLKNPVALITADEVALAGGKYNMKNQDYYLRTNGYFFTMTPSTFEAVNAYASVYRVNPAGELAHWNHVTNSHGVRAVINLSSNVLITKGEGTIDNPYILNLA